MIMVGLAGYAPTMSWVRHHSHHRNVPNTLQTFYCIAQYVNIYYRTPQLIREQQLKFIFSSQLGKTASEAKAKASHKKDV